jgi:hypothetical protein
VARGGARCDVESKAAQGAITPPGNFVLGQKVAPSPLGGSYLPGSDMSLSRGKRSELEAAHADWR